MSQLRSLALSPAVREIAVVGVPDARLGQQVHAVVVASDPDDPPDVAELRAFARRELAGFKVHHFPERAFTTPRRC